MSNYTITIAAVKPNLSDVSPGHVWYQISDGTNTTSYGYYPSGSGLEKAIGPGEIRVDYDKNQHPNPDWKQEIPITKEQYETRQKEILGAL